MKASLFLMRLLPVRYSGVYNMAKKTNNKNLIALRLPKPQLRVLDRIARALNLNRSEAIRQLLPSGHTKKREVTK